MAAASGHLDPCSKGVIGAQPCPEELKRDYSPAQRRLALAGCILASSMAFIDSSALTVALPALRSDLGAGISAVQWVLNGYVLALAAFVLIGGALADIYGKARILIIGCAAFAVASALCALSPTVEALIAARFAQGLAAALVAPSSLALIGSVYPKNMRNRAIGAWASASALTTAGGPVLGGWLTESFGWEWIFWINPPLALLAIGFLLAGRLRDYPAQRRFDLPGAALLAVALAAVAWSLSAIGPGEGGAHAPDLAADAAAGGAPPLAGVLGAGLLGVVLLAAFWVWERRTDHPMTPPRLYGNRVFTGLNLATMWIYAGLSIMFFMLPFELTDRRGLSAVTTGLAFLPFTLCVGFLSTSFGGLADRFGARSMLLIGACGSATAYALMALLRDAGFAVSVLAPMGLLGLSFALIVTPLTAAVMSSVDAADEGLASGMNNAASRVAQLVGVALAAGLASFSQGYAVALGAAAALSLASLPVVMRISPVAEPAQS